MTTSRSAPRPEDKPGSQTLRLRQPYYDRLKGWADQGRRPISHQLEIILEYYEEHHDNPALPPERPVRPVSVASKRKPR